MSEQMFWQMAELVVTQIYMLKSKVGIERLFLNGLYSVVTQSQFPAKIQA